MSKRGRVYMLTYVTDTADNFSRFATRFLNSFHARGMIYKSSRAFDAPGNQ